MQIANRGALLALAAMLTSTGFVACSKSETPIQAPQHDAHAEVRASIHQLGFSGEDTQAKIQTISDLGISDAEVLSVANDEYTKSLDTKCLGDDGQVCSTCVEHRMNAFNAHFDRMVESQKLRNAEAEKAAQARRELLASTASAIERLGFQGDDVSSRIQQISDLDISAEDVIELANELYEDSLDTKCRSEGDKVCSTCVNNRKEAFSKSFGEMVEKATASKTEAAPSVN